MNKRVDNLGLLVQTVLLVSLIYAFILTLFMSEFKVLLNIVLALTLFIMAYNNQTIYKKTGMTICYSIGGIICLLKVII
jgi:hypothetical protein